MYQQHMLLKLRKPILKITLNKYHVYWLSSFKRHYMANCLYLHDSYISELEFMNHLFANLLVVWL